MLARPEKRQPPGCGRTGRRAAVFPVRKAWAEKSPFMRLEPLAVAQLDEVIVADFQALKRVAAVGVVLLDQEILTAAGQARLDAGGHGQRALAHLGELHHVVEPAHELHNGLTIGEINTALGHFHFADAVILQVQQADAARVLFDKLNGILAAAVNPVDVQLKAQVFGVVLDDVQQILAVVACELHMWLW